MRCALISTTLLALTAGGAAAHPHAFIDGGLGFRLKDGEVTHLKVTWVFDAFYSLFALQEAGFDKDGDGKLTAVEEQALALYFSQWVDGYQGDSYIWSGDRRIGLSRPDEAVASLSEDGRIRMEFVRALETPLDPRKVEVTAKAYDPTYYTAYTITEKPEVTGDAACSVEIEAVDWSNDLAALQRSLLDYDQYATPEEPDVGAYFAETLRLTCAS